MRFGAVGRALPWLIGDWVNFGGTAYGEKYTGAIEITRLEVGTLMKLAYVAHNFERERRRADLLWTHHRAAAALAPPIADQLLERAADNRWSTRMLRAEARRHGSEVPKAPLLLPLGPEPQPSEKQSSTALWEGLAVAAEDTAVRSSPARPLGERR